MRHPDSIRRPTPSRATAMLAALALAGTAAPAAAAQDAPADFLAEWHGQFDASAQKFVALARAMPAEAWSWRPAEGVMSVAEVFMHVARYNYAYLDQNLGIDEPSGVMYEELQGVVSAKEPGVEILAASMEHVRRAADAMTAADMEATTTLYGRRVGKYAVLLQLVTHMNEHLGQSIAYARVNGVVPPWSS